MSAQSSSRYFQEVLENWLRELRHHSSDSVGRLLKVDESHADPIDLASHEAECSFQLRIVSRENYLIRKIEQSLKDIESGEYGICQMCGQEIAIGRLKARPVARYCITCKTETEAMEKIFGT